MAVRWAITLLLLLCVVTSALGVVFTQHTSRGLFVEIQQLKAAQDNLITHFGQLQLEQSAWSTHGRIEKIARDQRQMHTPHFDDVKIVYDHEAG